VAFLRLAQRLQQVARRLQLAALDAPDERRNRGVRQRERCRRRRSALAVHEIDFAPAFGEILRGARAAPRGGASNLEHALPTSASAAHYPRRGDPLLREQTPYRLQLVAQCIADPDAFAAADLHAARRLQFDGWLRSRPASADRPVVIVFAVSGPAFAPQIEVTSVTGAAVSNLLRASGGES
jgi:hypothetical protein